MLRCLSTAKFHPCGPVSYAQSISNRFFSLQTSSHNAHTSPSTSVLSECIHRSPRNLASTRLLSPH